jgi:hypothetical protein
MAIYSVEGKNVGIYCDLCGKLFQDKFIYYSGKIDYVAVDRSAGMANIVSVDRRFLDMDICTDCMEKLKKQMLEIINRRDKSGAWTTSTEKKK